MRHSPLGLWLSRSSLLCLCFQCFVSNENKYGQIINNKLNLNILYLKIVLCSYYKHRVNGSLFFRDLGKTVCFHSRTAGAYAPCNCKKRQCGVENNFRGKSWGMSQGRIIILKWSILKWSQEKQNKMRSFKNE